MKREDILKISDLLGLVHVPSMVDVPTAVKCSEACSELARLQKELRDWANNPPQAEASTE